MLGVRPLEAAEIEKLRAHLASHPLAARNVALFRLALQTGFRVAELLSLRLGDVVRDGEISRFLTVARRNMKRKVQSRTVPLRSSTREALGPYLTELAAQGYRMTDPLFPSPRFRTRAMTPANVWRIIHDAAHAAHCFGRIGTHSLRKTYAESAYAFFRAGPPEWGDPLMLTQRLLGHARVESTAHYLRIDEKAQEHFYQFAFGDP